MSTLKRFDEILQDLEKETEDLKKVSTLFKQFERVLASYRLVIEAFESNCKSIEDVKSMQITQQEKISDYLYEIKKINEQNNVKLENLLEKKTNDIVTSVERRLNDNTSVIKSSLKTEVNRIMDVLEREIPPLQKSIDSTIKHQKIILWLISVLGGIFILVSFITGYKIWFL